MTRTYEPVAWTTGGRSSGLGVTVLAGVFLLAIGAVTVVALVGVDVLTSVRAFVGGEGLWSKAEKDAAADLTRYLTDGEETAYAEFRRHLTVPRGDRLARDELEKPRSDLRVVRSSLVLGRIHHDDVDGLVRAYVRFRHVGPLHRAVRVWKRADTILAELEAVGERAHAAGPGLSEAGRRVERQRVHEINVRLTRLEDEFSEALGEAARQVRSLVQASLLAMSGLLVGVTLVATVHVARFLNAKEEDLRASENRYRQSFEANLAGMFRATRDGRILDGNAAFARILGASSPDELRGLRLRDLELANGRGREKDAAGTGDHEIRLRRLDGSPVWALVHENVLGSGPDAVREGSLIDVTGRRHAEDVRRFQATHDALTKLPNRLLVSDRLDLAILHARRSGERLAVMFLDLDNFKAINDRLGHATGDAVLVEVAARLKSCLRADDTVGRLGGDEFVFLVPGVAKERDAEALVEKILTRLSAPVTCLGHDVRLSASIGIAMYPDASADAEGLVAAADAAMYRAKSAGGSACQFAGPSR